MRITKYNIELDDDGKNMLVKESACNYEADSFGNPSIITKMLNDVFRLNRQAEEHLYMIALNSKSRLLGVFEVSHGIYNATLCTPREIFIRALMCGATMIVLAHNHPSGDVMPSKEDIKTHEEMKKAGELIGINLADNIVVAGSGYFSFYESSI